MKKKITAFILSAVLIMQVLPLGTSMAATVNIRRAGVIEDFSTSHRGYKSEGVSANGGLHSKKENSYIIYKLNDDISKAFISVTNGAENIDFKLSVSADGTEYTYSKPMGISTSFVYKQKAQILYDYYGFANGQKYIKIEFLKEGVSLNGVYVNVDSENTKYSSIYPAAFQNSSASGNADLTEDFKIYKKNLIKSLQTDADVNNLITSMSADGSWSNIVYDGKPQHSAYVHCDRINMILKAVSTPTNPLYKNEDALKKVEKAVDYWINKNITFDNWYVNAIVVPESMGEALLVSGDVVSKGLGAKMAAYMKSKVSYIDEVAKLDAGSNILHEMKAKSYYALYLDSLQLLMDCFNRINMEIIIVDDMADDQAFRDRMWSNYVPLSYLPDAKEGIQSDYSSLFHGPQIYSGGYGQEMIALLSTILMQTNGTNLFPKDGLKVLSDHILEHYAYIIRGETICYSTVGRHISEAGMKSGNTTIFSSLEKLLLLDNIPRKDELKALYESGKISADKPYLIPTYSAASVTASAEPQAESLAVNVIDGNLSTRWAANNPTDEITLDLGEEKTVGTIAISFYMGTARRANFELMVSADNNLWTTLFDGESTGVIADYEYYVFEPKEIRYIKLIGHGNSSNEWNSINEISAFDTITETGAGTYGESYSLYDEVRGVKRYSLIEPEPVPVPSVTGHKFFWKTDFTAHSKPNYLATIKSSSRRTIGGEALNTQNLKGNFLGDGCTYIYRTGKEYDDIFAAWDWKKIPGTTVETHDFDNITSVTHHFHSSESYRVGGVSDGNNGATAMELIHGGLSAKKAWFMFDNEFVALGTDINLAKSKYSAITTVNQSLLKSEVILGNKESETVINSESPESQKANWVIQDRIGYIFPENTKVKVSAKMQSGDRNDIDWGGVTVRPDKTEIVSKNIFALWFDHTEDETDSYEYTVVPNIDKDELIKYAKNNPVRVVANTGKVQAAEHLLTGEKQAVFWTPGEVEFSEFKLSADKEVLVCLKEENGVMSISAASLSQKEETVNIKITKENTDKEISIELPKGRYAGDSKTVTLVMGIE